MKASAEPKRSTSCSSCMEMDRMAFPRCSWNSLNGTRKGSQGLMLVGARCRPIFQRQNRSTWASELARYSHMFAHVGVDALPDGLGLVGGQSHGVFVMGSPRGRRGGLAQCHPRTSLAACRELTTGTCKSSKWRVLRVARVARWSRATPGKRAVIRKTSLTGSCAGSATALRRILRTSCFMLQPCCVARCFSGALTSSSMLLDHPGHQGIASTRVGGCELGRRDHVHCVRKCLLGPAQVLKVWQSVGV